jgi:hypothetical protein
VCRPRDHNCVDCLAAREGGISIPCHAVHTSIIAGCLNPLIPRAELLRIPVCVPSAQTMAARGSTLYHVLLCLLVVAVAPLAWGQALKTPMEPDSSLNQAGPLCIRTFYNITQRFYGTDKDCAFLIQQSFAAVRKDMCPKDGTGAGSPVQRCLSQSSVSSGSSFFSRTHHAAHGFGLASRRMFAHRDRNLASCTC